MIDTGTALLNPNITATEQSDLHQNEKAQIHPFAQKSFNHCWPIIYQFKNLKGIKKYI